MLSRRACYGVTRRLYSTQPQPQRRLAFAFDIDGVLKAGPNVLPQAKTAFDILHGNNPRNQKVPYVFITNGGGKDESLRAVDLSSDFGFPVSPSQVIQAHTVMKSLAPLYRDKNILMIGGPDDPPGAARSVMQGYGFNHVFTAHDLHTYAPASWPFSLPDPKQFQAVKRVEFSQIKFAAIFVFHDSREWGRDIQLIVDVLRSNNGVFGTEHRNDTRPNEQIPLFFSHGDLLWGNDHPVVRFGQGAFRLALENVWKHTTGRQLISTVFGKPHRLTYEYANELLTDLLISTHSKSSQMTQDAVTLGPSVWMVGDNPESDIAGANGYGWSSALVRTGVYKEIDGSPTHKPTIIVDNVEEAVKKALKMEWNL